jgi:hypothetical protein
MSCHLILKHLMLQARTTDAETREIWKKTDDVIPAMEAYCITTATGEAIAITFRETAD